MVVPAVMLGDVGAILSVAGLLFLLYIAVAIVTGALSLGGMIKASSEVVSGHKTTIMDCLKFAFGLIKDYIILGLRVFWYSLAWVLILAMILLPLLGNAFSGTANAQAPGEMPAEFMEMMEELESMEGMQGMEALGALEDMDFDAMGSYDYTGTYDMTPTFMTNPIFGLIFLALFIVVIYRSLQVIFAFYIFYDDPKIGTKAALEKSIKLMKGNMWRLIGYLIVFGLIIGVASGIITSVLLDPIAQALSSDINGFLMWQMILGFVLAAVVGPLTILYYYVTYKGWTKEHGHH